MEAVSIKVGYSVRLTKLRRFIPGHPKIWAGTAIYPGKIIGVAGHASGLVLGKR